MMRTAFALLIAIFVTASGIDRAQANCEKGEIEFKFGGYFDAEHLPRHRAGVLLKKAVDTELQGRACLTVLNDETQFKGTLGITALQNGTINLLAPQFSTLSAFVAPYGAFSLPFGFRDLSAVEKMQRSASAILSAQLAKSGLLPLGSLHGHFRQMASKRPMFEPEDVAGMKFREDAVPSFDRQITLLKATAQAVPENSLSTAIKSGRIEALAGGWQRLQADKSAAALGNVTETNHAFIGYQILTSSAFWNGVKPDLRKRIAELVARISRQINFETTSKTLGAKRSLIRSGIPVSTLTTKQRQKWVRALQPLWTDIGKSIGADLLVKLKKANAGL